MILIKKFFTILIVLFTLISNSNSQDLIVYLDLDNVVSNSKAGKLILEKLDKSKKSALLKFEKKRRIKKIEEEIKKQKILFEDELKKDCCFQKRGFKFRQERQKVINDFNNKKKGEFEEFFKKITPIIETYVNEKKIDIVLDKKNIFVGSKKKNITQEIIKIIDNKIK